MTFSSELIRNKYFGEPGGAKSVAGLIGFLTLLIFLLLIFFPQSVSAYEWTPSEGFAGWQFKNVGGIVRTDEGFLLRKGPLGDEFAVIMPKGDYGHCIHMVLRTMTAGSGVYCLIYLPNGRTLSRTKPFVAGEAMTEYSFDFTAAIPSNESIKKIIFYFHAPSVELADMRIRGESLADVFEATGLKPYYVNFLNPFMLYGYSLNLWFYGFLFLAGIIILLALLVKRQKGKFLALWGMVFLCCFVLYGLREDYEDFHIMNLTYSDFLRPPPGRKMYHYLAESIDFSDFIRHKVSRSEGPISFCGDHSEYLYFQYLLYPLKLTEMKHDRDIGRAGIFFHCGIVPMGNTLWQNGGVIEKGGRTIAYNTHSFLYVK